MSNVKVYSTPTCPYCHMVKDFLKEKGVEFEDIDVASDQAAAKEMIGKSGQMGVPHEAHLRFVSTFGWRAHVVGVLLSAIVSSLAPLSTGEHEYISNAIGGQATPPACLSPFYTE